MFSGAEKEKKFQRTIFEMNVYRMRPHNAQRTTSSSREREKDARRTKTQHPTTKKSGKKKRTKN